MHYRLRQAVKHKGRKPMSTQSVSFQSKHVADSSKSLNIVLWIFQILAAAMFLFAGTLKLAGAAPMVTTFDQIGIGQWFRYFTGGLEVSAAILLLIPKTSAIA